MFKVSYNPEVESSAADAWNTDDIGILLRHSHDRPSRIEIIQDTGIMMVVGVKSPVIEIFRFSSNEQAIKRRNKRLKKNPEDEKGFILKDLVRRGETLKATEEKIKSITGVCEKGTVKVLCCLPSNQLETITFPQLEQQQQSSQKEDSSSSEFESALMQFDGHRKLVRGIAFSSDKTAILTASGDSFKIWNRYILLINNICVSI